MRHGLALRIPVLGHLMKADFTGLELTQRLLAYRTYEPPPDARPQRDARRAGRRRPHRRARRAPAISTTAAARRRSCSASATARLLALKRHLRESGEFGSG